MAARGVCAPAEMPRAGRGRWKGLKEEKSFVTRGSSPVVCLQRAADTRCPCLIQWTNSSAHQLSVQTLNVAQSAFASAVFPDIFFKEYSVTGKIDHCKILLKVLAWPCFLLLCLLSSSLRRCDFNSQ